MALPGAIQDVARRLPAAAARLAGVPGSGGPLDDAEAEQVAEMLATLEASLGQTNQGANRTADALLSDDIPMLHLVAFAVRASKHNSPPAYVGAADGALAICLKLLDDSAPSHRRAKALVAFARKLLRMDTLKCCACQCASAAARLAALAGAGEAGAGEADAADAVAAAAGTVKCSALAHSLLFLATRTDVAVRRARSERQVEEWQQLQQQFAGELAAALCDSHVLEHAARLALHVQLAESAGRLPQGAAADPLTLVVGGYARAVHILQAQGGAPAHPLAEALSGPCVRHALLSLGVAALCVADGGPSYGLPPELLLRLPLLGPDYTPVTRGAPGKQRLVRSLFECMLQEVEDSNAAAAAAPPHGRCSVAALLHRVGSFAVTSARSWAEEAAEAGAGVPQLLLEEAGIMPVALLVLAALRELSGVEQAAPAADAAALATAEPARWRLAVEVATHCLRWAIPGGFRRLANPLAPQVDWRPQWDASDHLETLAILLKVDWRPPTPQWLLAPAAPLAVAAALAGGLPQLWERLLRCAGRDPECAEAVLLIHIMESPDVHKVFWVLLAYGEPRQGAALVATWGKLLRTLVVPRVRWSFGLGGSLELGHSSSRFKLACTLKTRAFALLSVARDRLEMAGLADPDGSEASAPQLQLARLSSLAACEWLPPLARLALEGMRALNRGVPDRHALVPAFKLSTDTVLPWVPVLSRLCWGGPEAAAAAGGPAAGSSAAAAAAAAGWRQLLLREIGAVEVLGTTSQHVSGTLTFGSDFSRRLLEGCSWLAVACPSEVRQAVLAAAAVPGSGGRRGGPVSSGAGGPRTGWGDEAGPSRAAAPPPAQAWSPQQFRAMEAKLRVCPGGEGEALGALAGIFARQAEQWVAGGVEDAAELARASGMVRGGGPIACALRASSPAAARALLRTCSNPACDNLAGDSETELQLRACGRCGAAWYCRRECSVFHYWRAGHKEACVGRKAATAAEAGPGQSAA